MKYYGSLVKFVGKEDTITREVIGDSKEKIREHLEEETKRHYGEAYHIGNWNTTLDYAMPTGDVYVAGTLIVHKTNLSHRAELYISIRPINTI